MNKPIFLFFTFLIFLQFNTKAGDRSLFEKNRFNIYTNGLYFDYSYALDDPRQNKYTFNAYDFGFLSIAIEKTISNYFNREFEWLPVRFKYQSSADYIINTRDSSSYLVNGDALFLLESALRYQINYYPFVNNERKVNPYVGISSRFNFERYVREPKVSSFKTAQSAIGLGLQLSPGFEYKISSTASFVFDLPLTFFSLKFKARRIDNPAIPIEEQLKYHLDQEFFPTGVNFRLGLKLNFKS
jgi:hypothetical protein